MTDPSNARSRGLALARVAAMLAAIAGPASAAEFTVSYGIGTRVEGKPAQNSSGSASVAAGGSLGDSVTITNHQDGLATSAIGISRSSAGHGWLRSFAQGSAQLWSDQPDRSTDNSLGGNASFTDTFIIDCDACAAGTVGVLSATARLVGTHREDGGFVGPAGDGEGVRHAGMTSWFAGVGLSAEGVPPPEPPPWPDPPLPDPSQFQGNAWEYSLNYDGFRDQWGGTSDREGFGFSRVSVAFVFGQPIHLNMSLSTDLLAAATAGYQPGGGQAWAMSTADYTLLWGGIDGIWSGDQQITGFTALNAQGFDYALAAAVPEPSTWLMMLAGVGLLAAVARRSRRARTGGAITAPLWCAAAGLTSAGLVQAQAPAEFVTSHSMSVSVADRPTLTIQESRSIAAGERHGVARHDSDDGNGFGAAAHGAAWMSAGYGWVNGYSSGATRMSSPEPSSPATVMADASATMIDTFVIACPVCLPGTRGSMRFSVVLDHAYSVAGALPDDRGTYMSFSHWVADLRMEAAGVPIEPGPPPQNEGVRVGQEFGYQLQTQDRRESVTRTDGALELRSLGVDFIFGEPIRLQMQLMLNTLTVAGTGEVGPAASWANSVSHMPGGFHWDGIDAITTATGESITDFTALNAVGVDYARALAAPIPEPATWLMLTFGAAALLARRRLVDFRLR